METRYIVISFTTEVAILSAVVDGIAVFYLAVMKGREPFWLQ